ncbi:Cyclic pyranopterin monophosphate synthase [Actinidia chinensis var. chinensis]|uniref:Cyclic pyranopterin monophosphate synthase n=1 Tax=Actinidia chinensis var. chinensis TaxID=1590841 RepID=A0A2R6Q116_ACTCC|nr:Cyclic pyranopterin monophosphate synthase [Actinidia chinensis var. chinensis]
MKWWHKVVVPLQRVWIAVAKRVGIRKTGLVKLRHDVRTCEYEDVHVLWEMLKRNETEPAGPGTKKRHFWNICV